MIPNLAADDLDKVGGNVILARVRARYSTGLTTATVTFTQATTLTTNAVPNTFSLGMSTTSSSAQLIVATTTLQDAVNTNRLLINQIIDVLQAKSLALST